MTKVPEGTVTTETSKAAVLRLLTRLAEGYTMKGADENGLPVFVRTNQPPGWPDESRVWGVCWKLYAVKGAGRQWHIVEIREDHNAGRNSPDQAQ